MWKRFKPDSARDESAEPVSENTGAATALTKEQEISAKLRKLQGRIKNTSSVRFAASKRVRFNYNIAQLTIVALSIWAIIISTTLAFDVQGIFSIKERYVELIGILLPVCIVAFSLIENGEVYLRSAFLEINARQLRELSDQLFVAIEKADGDLSAKIEVFSSYSQKYNDILERSPINHDDVDHYTKKYEREREKYGMLTIEFWLLAISSLFVTCRRQVRRVLYITLWLMPLLLFNFSA